MEQRNVLLVWSTQESVDTYLLADVSQEELDILILCHDNYINLAGLSDEVEIALDKLDLALSEDEPNHSEYPDWDCKWANCKVTDHRINVSVTYVIKSGFVL